ncbi:TIGR03620 family F420-dependent LLM class oxidoreductase [Lentzea sp. BCCO 10_0856]|uniref:TIGR03620 family F420-dependent LLM class oxidoreductase n=1 Tax=Lentzea miocenica TaxID=3095431 RepID=A0ABU4SVR8_9PSEU|nr:TIGR03620 family F420-dependent LLM class oxidoreductase [Lentzea sp. BCCO 10_0856]MDX8029968.1 TIGR03620 family F420-dependent LLM class oxidoreductase [Lentzea sp. BCCO 10_0856]
MLGTFGVWGSLYQWGERMDEVADLESLGYGTFWVGSSPPSDLALVEKALDVTRSMTIATGVLNVWQTEPEDVSRSFQRLGSDRVVLGVGVGHRQIDQSYEKPYPKLVSYLDRLDVPADRLLLAALGPKVLQLAADRTAGAHPYLVPVGHTAEARKTLGDKILAPEVTVVVEEDPEAARAIAREQLSYYFSLTNYTNNWLRWGFSPEDVADLGSDRLIDALVAHGSPDQVAAKLRAHVDAGADHVAVQSLNGHYAELAAALGLKR